MVVPHDGQNICELLNEQGRLLVSVPVERERETMKRRDDQRLFVPASVVFQALGQPCLRIPAQRDTPDSLGRGIRWVNAILEYRRRREQTRTVGGSLT